MRRMGLALTLGAGLLACDRSAPAPDAGSALVTFRNGQKCVFSNATFSNEVILAPPEGVILEDMRKAQARHQKRETQQLNLLRDAEPLVIPQSDVMEIRFYSGPDPDKPTRVRVSGIDIVTKSGAVESFSPTDDVALVPDVAEIEPSAGARVRLFLRAENAGHCDRVPFILMSSLDQDMHEAPVRVEFP